MSKIIKLDKNLANQISAGEVVERPVSIVKELVENSIDAKADFISVSILDGGKTFIEIKDNGVGLDRDDLEICLEKYTTSKIKNLQDLYNIMTFGFRGEALSSISSVSKIDIKTKTNNSIEAYNLTFDTDSGQNILKTTRESGTTIIVKDLFYNTPARLNYLKKDKTEYTHILNYMQNIVLSYPEIGFEFISEGKQIFKYNKNEDLKTRIYQIYSDDLSKNIFDISFELTGIKIEGYISNPKINFPNRNRQHLFINNRPINSFFISKAITDAYNRFIPHKTYPFYVLNIKVDPTLVDVNVHPRKQEVRFACEQNIFRAVYHSILNKLESSSLIDNTSFINDDNFQKEHTNFSKQDLDTKSEKYYTGSGTKFKSYSPYKNISHNPSQTKITNSMNFTKSILDTKDSSFINDNSLENTNDLHYTKLGKIVGQTFNSYIIVEKDSKIFIYDQHALAERILYEKLLKNDAKNTLSSQSLIIGENIKLTPIELDILNQYKNHIENMGFKIEILSNNIIQIISIPDFIRKENIKEIFLKILDDIHLGNLSKSNSLQEVKNKIYAYTACRGSIKFGHKLNLFEMNKLLNEAVEGYSSTCPHGRPVIFDIDIDDLKNKYER